MPANPPGSDRLRVLIAGASGMIGTELCRQLAGEGHTVTRLVRRAPQSASEIGWAPSARIIDYTVMDRVDAVVNLSGASLSRVPWTRGYRRRILDSRVESTRTLTDAMGMAARPPTVFICASAVGYYGGQPSASLTEGSPRGKGFLSDVVDAWEHAAQLAPEGTRTVLLRTGVVLGRGGAMRPLLPLARLGLAGPIGTGTQFWPWISLHDEARAIRHLLDSGIAGPVNLAGPTPATAGELLRELARSLHRPYGLPLPAPVVRTVLGEAAEELLLANQRVVPSKLLDDGFTFRHETIRQAIDWLVER